MVVVREPKAGCWLMDDGCYSRESGRCRQKVRACWRIHRSHGCSSYKENEMPENSQDRAIPRLLRFLLRVSEAKEWR